MTKRALAAKVNDQKSLIEKCKERFSVAEEAYNKSKTKANRSEYNKSKFALEQAEKELERITTESEKTSEPVKRKAISEKVFTNYVSKSNAEIDYKSAFVKTLTTTINGLSPAQIRKLSNDISNNTYSETIRSSLDFVENCFKNMKQEERVVVAGALKLSIAE